MGQDFSVWSLHTLPMLVFVFFRAVVYPTIKKYELGLMLVQMSVPLTKALA